MELVAFRLLPDITLSISPMAGFPSSPFDPSLCRFKQEFWALIFLFRRATRDEWLSVTKLRGANSRQRVHNTRITDDLRLAHYSARLCGVRENCLLTAGFFTVRIFNGLRKVHTSDARLHQVGALAGLAKGLLDRGRDDHC